MKITITEDSTNEIIFSGLAPRSQHESMLQAGQTMHYGNYPASRFDYDGSEFNLITPQEQPESLIDLNDKQFRVLMVRALIKAGYPLPFHYQKINTKKAAYEAVNLAASQACERYVSHGKFIVIEYILVEQDIKAWRLGGSVEADAPEVLLSWFENESFTTLNDAAIEIETAAQSYRSTIELTRRIRLEARNAINQASTDYQVVIDPFITRLNAI